MDSLNVVILVSAVSGVYAGEFCLTNDGHEYEYCDNGCCGSYPNHNCCGAEVWIIVLGVIGVIIFISFIITIICCIIQKKKRNPGFVVHPDGSTNVATISGQSAGYTQPIYQQPGYPPPGYNQQSGYPPPAYNQQQGYPPPPPPNYNTPFQ